MAHWILRRACRRVLVGAVVASAIVAPRLARSASPADKAAAQALFDDALRSMKEGLYEPACKNLEESQRLDPAMGTRFQLAQCYEAVGRTASAWAAYLELADLTRTAGQTRREEVARARATALAPQLSRVIVAVASPPAPGLEVSRDGVVIGAAQWGLSLPIDPGVYHVTAHAPGKAPWEADATVERGPGTVTVRVPALVDLPPRALSPVAASVAGMTSPAKDAETVAPAAAPARHLRRDLGIGLLSAGVVAAGVGVALGFGARSDYDSVGSHCQGSACDSSGLSTTNSARTLGDVATAVVAIGAAGAAVGVILWVTAPSSSSRATGSLRVGARAIVVDVSF